MSTITLKDKCIIQAQQINFLQLQSNYLIRELYKLKPDHEVFVKNPQLATTLKGVIDAEQRRLGQSANKNIGGPEVKV